MDRPIPEDSGAALSLLPEQLYFFLGRAEGSTAFARIIFAKSIA
jgi:hypothetical protein